MGPGDQKTTRVRAVQQMSLLLPFNIASRKDGHLDSAGRVSKHSETPQRPGLLSRVLLGADRFVRVFGSRLFGSFIRSIQRDKSSLNNVAPVVGPPLTCENCDQGPFGHHVGGGSCMSTNHVLGDSLFELRDPNMSQVLPFGVLAT